MPVPTPAELQKIIDQEREHIDRLEKARSHFLTQWATLEREQSEVVASLRQYMDKIKMRDVLENIHSIKE